jgi:hypothetical protein
MFWTQLDWLSAWAFMGALSSPGIWEIGSLIGSPSTGLGSFLGVFSYADFFVQAPDRGFLGGAFFWSCAHAFFLDQAAAFSASPFSKMSGAASCPPYYSFFEGLRLSTAAALAS